jgi:hypothetical protein
MRLSAIPRDLDAVTRIDTKKEVDPASVGMSQADVDRIWDHVIRVYRTGVHPAITINLRRRGRIVMARSIGHARGNGPDDGPKASGCSRARIRRCACSPPPRRSPPC